MSLLKIAQQKIGKRFLPAEAAPPEEEQPGYRAANLQGLGARTTPSRWPAPSTPP